MRVSLLQSGESYDRPEWSGRYRFEWSQIIGSRVRRLRQQRGLTISEVAAQVSRADGRPYSASTISRLERGWASPPLFVYLRVAQVLDVSPGALLGSEGVESPVSQAELTLVRILRRMELEPEEAIARLAGITPAAPVRRG